MKVEEKVWTEEEVDHRLAWTSCASEVSTLRAVVAKLKTAAGGFFVTNQNELANHFKWFAEDIEKNWLKEEENRLDRFIKENK